MKISIENFKSIRKLHHFEIKPFTVLSGVNSAGKSSFVQLLLLLKQTVESREPLLLKGELYKINSFQDIISNRDLNRKLKISFEFSKTEIQQFNDLPIISVFNPLGDYNCLIEIEYDVNKSNGIIVAFFFFKFNSEAFKEQFIKIRSSFDNAFSIETNSAIFGKNLFYEKPNITDIQYSSIYPDKYDYRKNETLKMGDREATNFKFSKETINLDDIKVLINTFLQNISYIGPNREVPKDEYSISRVFHGVGINGEFTAQILEEEAQKPIDYYTVEQTENRLIYKENKGGVLVEAVKYWMCDVFDVAADIRAKKENETYKIILTNNSGLETSIKHVGFGISQLLPMVVEGLAITNNCTLIIEQPEIHLHPKLQSKLFDFLYGLTLQGKKVIIETHSSHFITRMRRRIAENETNKMSRQTGLTFIENNIFRSIELDDYGTMDYYPEDFIEESNTELKAIIKAQMKKRAKK